MKRWQLSFSNYASYHQLMRMDKPIGIYLLLWPTLWALWIASIGVPDLHNLLVFGLGVVLMRAAGCVIQLFIVLIGLAFVLVLTLDFSVVVLSVIGLLLAASYPFMKRYTHFPQVVLGAAFSWGMPMAFMSIKADLPTELWILYFANLFWTVAYDTFYAMVDRDDDLKIGVKSTAIAFGKYDLMIIAILQAQTIWLFYQLFVYLNWHWPMAVVIAIASLMFVRQLWMARTRDPQACFTAFLNNHWVGLILFIGIVVEYWLF
jgi:4-hydroxybenzoate polyprenyltransferase